MKYSSIDSISDDAKCSYKAPCAKMIAICTGRIMTGSGEEEDGYNKTEVEGDSYGEW